MTTPQEIPDWAMREARNLAETLLGSVWRARDVDVLSRALLARDTAARKDQARKDAEIARKATVMLSVTSLAYVLYPIKYREQIATAIEASIGGRDAD